MRISDWSSDVCSSDLLPIFYNYKPSAHRGYLFDEATPLWPFGFGLSYTQFDLGAPVLSQSTIRPGEGVTVTVPVTNRGGMAGDEVVQIYLRDDASPVTRPGKRTDERRVGKAWVSTGRT